MSDLGVFLFDAAASGDDDDETTVMRIDGDTGDAEWFPEGTDDDE